MITDTDPIPYGPFDSPEEFWELLIRITTIDSRLLREYRDRPPELWQPFGRTMLDLKLLAMKQITRLLRIQAMEPHMRIGELAVREGLCSQEQIDEAIEIHRSRCPHPFELLARDQRLDGKELFAGALEYVRFLEGRMRKVGQKAVVC